MKKLRRTRVEPRNDYQNGFKSQQIEELSAENSDELKKQKQKIVFLVLIFVLSKEFQGFFLIFKMIKLLSLFSFLFFSSIFQLCCMFFKFLILGSLLFYHWFWKTRTETRTFFLSFISFLYHWLTHIQTTERNFQNSMRDQNGISKSINVVPTREKNN